MTLSNRMHSSTSIQVLHASAILAAAGILSTVVHAGPLTIVCDEGDPPVFTPPLHDGEEVRIIAVEAIFPTWDSTVIADTSMELFDTLGGTRELVAVEFHYFHCTTVDITLHPNTEQTPVGSQGDWEWSVNFTLPDDGGLILPFGNNLLPHGLIGGANGFGFGRNVGFAGETFEDVVVSSFRPDLTTAPEYLAALSGTGTTTLHFEATTSDITYSDLETPPWVYDPDFLEIALDEIQIGVKAHFYYNDVEQPPCPADIADDDGDVNVFDLLELLSAWGTNGPGANIAEPHNDIVDVFDLLELLQQWGPCD